MKKKTPWYVWAGLGVFLFCCMCPVGFGVLGNLTGISNKNSEDPFVDSKRAEVPSEEVNVPEIVKEDLEVLEHKFVWKDSVGYIVGKVRNNTSRKYGYVQIEINLRDKENSVVGSALANVNNLEAGDVWKFEAVVLQDKFDSYEIKEVSGF